MGKCQRAKSVSYRWYEQKRKRGGIIYRWWAISLVFTVKSLAWPLNQTFFLFFLNEQLARFYASLLDISPNKLYCSGLNFELGHFAIYSPFRFWLKSSKKGCIYRWDKSVAGFQLCLRRWSSINLGCTLFKKGIERVPKLCWMVLRSCSAYVVAPHT